MAIRLRCHLRLLILKVQPHCFRMNRELDNEFKLIREKHVDFDEESNGYASLIISIQPYIIKSQFGS